MHYLKCYTISRNIFFKQQIYVLFVNNFGDFNKTTPKKQNFILLLNVMSILALNQIILRRLNMIVKFRLQVKQADCVEGYVHSMRIFMKRRTDFYYNHFSHANRYTRFTKSSTHRKLGGLNEKNCREKFRIFHGHGSLKLEIKVKFQGYIKVKFIFLTKYIFYLLYYSNFCQEKKS